MMAFNAPIRDETAEVQKMGITVFGGVYRRVYVRR